MVAAPGGEKYYASDHGHTNDKNSWVHENPAKSPGNQDEHCNPNDRWNDNLNVRHVPLPEKGSRVPDEISSQWVSKGGGLRIGADRLSGPVWIGQRLP